MAHLDAVERVIDYVMQGKKDTKASETVVADTAKPGSLLRGKRAPVKPLKIRRK
ncbi:MAG: hypothetical protein ABSE71_02720 [Candidatus Micrarchaeaceae archaeon]|jgi:hypothetical protein|nr:hypothetical protein [Candidatus Micrarchaeota archaeon]HII09711.1 hypothetical protein [Candidatus Micrarchaeota archaeon]